MRERNGLPKTAALSGADEGQMSNKITGVRKFLADRRGVTALEYGIVACALTVAFVVCFTKLATDLGTLMGNVGAGL
jgi:Flp pilus assembly pilin Flp